MLKVLISLLLFGGAGTSYIGFTGGDQSLGYTGAIIAAIFAIVLIFMFMKAIGCMVTVIVIAGILFAIAYFGGFVTIPGVSSKSGSSSSISSSGGFFSKLFDKSDEKAKPNEPKQPVKISGIAKVYDGNTVILDGVRINLYGVEAPRPDQTCTDRFNRSYYCGTVSTEKLATMLGQNPIDCTIIGRKEGKTYGVCMSGKDDVGAFMVGLGYAFPNPEFGQVYFPYESNARTKRLGLWEEGSRFNAPWQWDKMKTDEGKGVTIEPAKVKKQETGTLWKNFF